MFIALSFLMYFAPSGATCNGTQQHMALRWSARCEFSKTCKYRVRAEQVAMCIVKPKHSAKFI